MIALLKIVFTVGAFFLLVLSPAWFFVVVYGLAALGLVLAFPGMTLALLGLGCLFGGDDGDV